MRIMFFLASSHLDNTSSSPDNPVRIESVIFDDILQFDIEESYFNNTFKVLALYEWLWKRCSKARYLFKMDDDVFFNLVLFLNETLPNKVNATSLYGFVSVGGKVQYRAHNKQYVPKDIYPYRRFHFTYVYGFAIFSSVQVVIDIHALASCLRGLYVDDVWLNGYIMHLLGHPKEDLHKLNAEIINKRKNIQKLDWEYVSKFLITPQLEPEDLTRIYNEMIRNQTNSLKDFFYGLHKFK